MERMTCNVKVLDFFFCSILVYADYLTLYRAVRKPERFQDLYFQAIPRLCELQYIGVSHRGGDLQCVGGEFRVVAFKKCNLDE